MTAVFGLISIKDAKAVFTTHKQDLPVYAITFLVTLFVGIKEGLVAGVLVNWLINRKKAGADVAENVEAQQEGA